MNILFESIIVGLYSLFLYICLNSICVYNLFILGFIKHWFGYLFLHKYYCIYGNSCQNIDQNTGQTTGQNTDQTNSQNISSAKQYIGSKTNPYIIIESIGEGLLYLLLGYIMIRYAKINKLISVFTIGFVLHLIFEIIGIHRVYCNQICI